MCGIIGSIGKNIDSRFCEQGIEAILHRGPDSQGTWQSPDTRVFFGHTRLSIIDLSSAGSQPMMYKGKDGHEYQIVFNGEDITNLSADKRAKLGLFMSFQSPIEISGITFTNFLRTSYNAIKGTDIKVGDFTQNIKEKMKFLEIDEKFRTRSVNVGFSGGEKKRAEVLQLMVLEPKFAILDEVDSGLDVDALKIVAKGINYVKEKKHKGHTLEDLKKLEDFGYRFEKPKSEHELAIMKGPCTVILYKNGKLLVQGKKEVKQTVQKLLDFS